ncbi:MAG: ribonuclease III [Melioribacteraceae bacterium]|nr:ribonuclease III [Melioribacteraceae bacterium]MCF8264442.1 ribonuclease III [Melioribacteraceae bacterium]MCF8414186.1 ribonuclease III [Melioribacteraceae bacterium]MCF8432223.1 ribonuclease III [Melioribacteraceae bacterium]
MFKKLHQFFSKFKKIRITDFTPNYVSGTINNLSQKLSIKFTDPALYIEALTHRSIIEKESNFKASNQRLEFLGDAVLGLITAEYLFSEYSAKNEGFLTKSRSKLVDREALALAANNMNLGDYVFYDKRFIKLTDSGFDSILADAMEALIGAIYIDCGFQISKKFVINWVIEPGLRSGLLNQEKNYKGKFLELLHSEKRGNPRYVVVNEVGQEHKKVFTIQIELDNEILGSGKGRSKKIAEQKAAREALKNYKSHS